MLNRNQYKVIETLLVALIYAIGYIPTDVRSQFLRANERAVKFLEDLAGIKLAGKSENPDQLKLFNDALNEDAGDKEALSPLLYHVPPASSPTKEVTL